MKVIIDRFEGSYAVCEICSETCLTDADDNSSKDTSKAADKDISEASSVEMISIQKSKLPSEAKEGDVVLITAAYTIIDTVETEKRKKEIELLTKDLWK